MQRSFEKLVSVKSILTSARPVHSSSFAPSCVSSTVFTMPTTRPNRPETRSIRRQYTSSGSGDSGVKVQFPELPKEWRGKFVKGQMYKYQDTLPRLPVPALEQSLRKYLDTVKLLVPDKDFERTKKIVDEFGKPGGVGELLQKKLIERAEMKESWLLEWWNEVAYLGFRQPVVVHSNPAVGFPPQPYGDKETFARTVAKIIYPTLQWNLLIQNHAIPPDIYRNRPMCMAQYDMYSKCRIPSEAADVVKKTPFKDSRHIIVMRNGHFYKLDVIYECPDGTLALSPPDHFIKEIIRILETTPDTCEHPVGILTSEHRDAWCESRKELLLDPVNKASLDSIETAQSVLSLDQASPPMNFETSYRYWDKHKTILANRYLHGNGTDLYSCNRWSDSSIQTLCGEDGGVGSIMEHSAADGVCAISVDLFIMDLNKIHDVLSESSPVPRSLLRPFKPLQWNISPRIAQDIEIAKDKMNKLARDVDMHVATYTEYGKSLPKRFKLSPDGFIQNAILLTYYKIYNKMAPMYESGGTRWYRLGRTDTIRNTTQEAYTFIKTMMDSTASNMEKANALVDAVKAHSRVTVEALEGQAFDRHMLGLSLIAKENKMEVPEIFKDSTYRETMSFRISTSQVPVGNHEMYLFFGAVMPDGYGVCYNPQEKQVIFSVSSFHSCPKTNSLQFLEKLTDTMSEMRAVIITSKELTAKL